VREPGGRRTTLHNAHSSFGKKFAAASLEIGRRFKVRNYPGMVQGL